MQDEDLLTTEADFKRIQNNANTGAGSGSRLEVTPLEKQPASFSAAGKTSEPTTRLPAPDGGVQAWCMVGGAFTVMMHSSSMHYITGIFYVEWLETFPNQSRAAVAGCGSLSTAIMFGAAYLSGRLQFRWQSQGLVVILGAVLAAVGLLLTSYAQTLWQLYLAYGVVLGVGHALSFPPCPVVVSTWFSSRTGTALGVTTAGASLGTVYLGTISSYLVDSLGWRTAFRVLAALTLLAIGGAGLFFRVPGGKRADAVLGALLRASLQRCLGFRNSLRCSGGFFSGGYCFGPSPPSCCSSSSFCCCSSSSGTDGGGTGEPSSWDPEQSHVESSSPFSSSSPPPPSSSSFSPSTTAPVAPHENDPPKSPFSKQGKNELHQRAWSVYQRQRLESGSGGGDRGSELGLSIASQSRRAKGKLQVMALLKHPRFRRLCVSYLLVSFAFDVPFVHLVRFALDSGLSKTLSQSLTLAVGVGGLSRVLVASASDKYGCERVFLCVLLAMAIANAALPQVVATVAGGTAYAVVIGSTTGCLVALVLPLATAALKPSAGVSLTKAGEEAMQALGDLRSSAILRFDADAEMEEEKRAAAADWPPSASITSGLVYSMLAIGISAGPALAGWLFDVTGSYAAGFRAASAFCFAACVASSGLKPAPTASGDSCPRRGCSYSCFFFGGSGGGATKAPSEEGRQPEPSLLSGRLNSQGRGGSRAHFFSGEKEAPLEGGSSAGGKALASQGRTKALLATHQHGANRSSSNAGGSGCDGCDGSGGGGFPAGKSRDGGSSVVACDLAAV